ncbi:GIN domain-containing protein [Flavobacterium sp.]|uniref:GIN domain-containing protein n=1 Tax=Flavobacterium sp. TaxID=239 RepID=UPI003C3829DF
MKKYTVILLLIICSTITLAQKKEKIKGSNTVTTKNQEISDFKSIEVNDNIEVYLERGDKPAIKIEADDNLHEIITTTVTENTLSINTSKEAYRYKKLIVHVTYTNTLNLIQTKDKSTINAIQELELDAISLKSYGDSKMYLNVNSQNFTLESNDKSKIELNLKSEKGKIVLSQNATLKALIKTIDFTCDMYQKSEAIIEGNTTNSIIRLDNNAKFIGNKFSVKDLNLTAESYSTSIVNAENAITLSANGKAEVQFIGAGKLEIKNFSDEAKLFKKLK